MIQIKLKEKVYLVVVKLTLLYNSECLPIKKSQVQRLTVVEMRMIKWICVHKQLDTLGMKLMEIPPLKLAQARNSNQWFSKLCNTVHIKALCPTYLVSARSAIQSSRQLVLLGSNFAHLDLFIS